MSFTQHFSVDQEYWDNHCTTKLDTETEEPGVCVSQCEACVTPLRARSVNKCVLCHPIVPGTYRKLPALLHVEFDEPFTGAASENAADFTTPFVSPYGCQAKFVDTTPVNGDAPQSVTLVSPVNAYEEIWETLYAKGCISQSTYESHDNDISNCRWVNAGGVSYHVVAYSLPYGTTFTAVAWDWAGDKCLLPAGNSGPPSFSTRYLTHVQGALPNGTLGFVKYHGAFSPPENLHNWALGGIYVSDASPGTPCNSMFQWPMIGTVGFGTSVDDLDNLADIFDLELPPYFGSGPVNAGGSTQIWPTPGFDAGIVPASELALSAMKLNIQPSGYYWKLENASGLNDSNGVSTHILSLHVFHHVSEETEILHLGWNTNGSYLKNVAPDGVDNSKLIDGITPVWHDGGTFTCGFSTRTETVYEYWQHDEITYPRDALWGFYLNEYDGFVPSGQLCGGESAFWFATPIDWRTPAGWADEATFVSAFNPEVSIATHSDFGVHPTFAASRPGDPLVNSNPGSGFSLARWKVEPSMRVCDDRTEYDLILISSDLTGDPNPNWSTHFPTTGKLRFA